MPNTGHPSFDKTVEKTNRILKEIEQALGWPKERRNQSYAALRAVLHAIRDRLTVEEAAQLAAQLPMLVRGLYFEGWDPTRAPIKNEADNKISNAAYTIAMARTSDPHSATAQFFINVADNKFLDHTAPTPQGWGYCVFGRVVEGNDVVDRIKGVKTGAKGMHQDVPLQDVIIERAEAV